MIYETASKLRIEIDSLPEELDDVERRIKQLEIERVAVKRDKNKASEDRLHKINMELANLHEEGSQLRSHWELEKNVIL